MHRLVLNTLINLLIIIVAITGAWHFVVEKYMGLPMWLSIIMALVAVGAVIHTVYVEFVQDYKAWRVERNNRE